jgi:hypothetical protein
MFRKKKDSPIIAFILLLLSTVLANAQGVPSIMEWQKCYGLDSWYGDEGTKIIPLAYNHYAAVGKKTMQGYESIWVSKLNYKGEVVWETNAFDNKQFIGFRAIDIVQSNEGYYYVVGRVINSEKLYFNALNNLKQATLAGKGYYDTIVLKLNADGQMIWSKVIGGSGEDIPTKIIQTPDNNILLLTYTTSPDGDIANSGKTITEFNRDLWLVKLNQEDGNILTKKCIGGTGDDFGYDMKPTNDGNYVIVGSTNSNDDFIKANKGGKDILAIKMDANYNIIWKKTYGGNESDEARRVLVLPNGDIILGINSNSFTNDFEKTPNEEFPNNYESNIWLLRLNAAGELQNKKIFGGADNDILNDLIATRDGNFMIAGSTKSNNGTIKDRNRIPSNNNGKFDVVLIKTSTNFDVFWEKTMGGSADDEGNGVVENGDGTIVTIGTTQSFGGDVSGNHFSTRDARDIWLVKLTYPCEANINTSADLVASNVELLAGESITTSDRVKQNSSIHYGANKNVDITDGFDSEVGNVIEFNVYGCTGGAANIDKSHPIQMKVNNECREGGIKMKIMPFTPNTDLSQYRMSVQNFTPTVEYSFAGNTIITKNNAPNTTSVNFTVTIARDGYEDFTYQVYANTCDHDNAPLDCPENNNDVILDKEYYQIGDTFTATWTGSLVPNQSLLWYNTNVSEISKSGNIFKGRIDSLPATIQAQGSPLPDGTRPCHGSTRVEFRQPK